MTRIESFQLPTTPFDAYTTQEQTLISTLTPTSSINIFVGSNNSGKSRFIRMLSAEKKYYISIKGINLASINSQIQNIFDQLKASLLDAGFSQVNDFSNKSIDALQPLPNFLCMNADSFQGLREAFLNGCDLNLILSGRNRITILIELVPELSPTSGR